MYDKLDVVLTGCHKIPSGIIVIRIPWIGYSIKVANNKYRGKVEWLKIVLKN